MTAALCILILAAAGLFAQHRAQVHALNVKSYGEEVHHLYDRVITLERAQTTKYDHAAFEDLKGKVEAMRIAKGLKV
jgi:hypothetical protein